MCNPETKVGVQSLQDKIIGTKSATLRYNIPDMLEHIKSTMDLIKDMSETHDNLLKDTSGALLIAPNTHFTQFFEYEKILWEARKHYNYNTLDSMAKTVYNNMHTNKTWNTVDPKDTKILVLHTKITKVKEEPKKAHDNSLNGGTSGTPDYVIE